MKSSLITICLFSCLWVSGQIPNSVIGNWINCETNNWEYGFFEKFAIYEGSFWNYGTISTKNGKTIVSLQKEGKTISLSLTQQNDSLLNISNGKQKAQTYCLMQKHYPRYKKPDHTPFPTPSFQQDSITITGYYRNFDKIPEEYKEQYYSKPFKVSVPDFIKYDAIDYYTTIDSLGRFRIRIPVMNTQEVFIDRDRFPTDIPILVTPSDSLFLFADMNDMIQKIEEGWDEYQKRGKQILCMGKDARLNNELFQYIPSGLWVNTYELEKNSKTHMEYLKGCKDVYDQKINHLNKYIVDNPSVSDKFRYYLTGKEKYILAADLLQYYYSLDYNNKERFQQGYMEYISEHIPLTNEIDYTMFREFRRFLSYYLAYYSRNKFSVTVIPKNALTVLESRGEPVEAISSLITLLEETNEQCNTCTDSLQKQALAEECKRLYDSVFSHKSIRPALDEWAENEFFEQRYQDIDSLIDNNNLKQLMATNTYIEAINEARSALKNYQLPLLNERITNPYLHEYVLKTSNYFSDISKKSFAHEASLKNTDYLKNTKDADTIFQKLIEPYKGKVIYLDFWGTWCSPCKEQMPHVGALKKALQGKDVIFMYLAASSPEQAWKNIIKEFNLTGENIVHYRLPDEQQKLIQNKLGIKGFPTYMLINKEGELVNNAAPRPMKKDEVVKEIKKLLE